MPRRRGVGEVIWRRGSHTGPWWVISASVGGLLLAIAIVGVVGLAINERVANVTARAIEYDIELEDRGDDFRVAVLDVRHYHRNIVFSGPSRRGIADFEGAYLRLREQIVALESLGVADPQVAQPDQLSAMAGSYYAELRPAIDTYSADREAFTRTSDRALTRLAELESAAQDIDKLGEERAAASLQSVEDATGSARLILLAVLGGLVLIGLGLAYSAGRMLRAQQAAASQLARALQTKSDFIADASHELRTPLTVLRANAEVALELDRTCVHTELIEEIVRESERMTHLVEDLLFLARSDAGSPPLDIQPLDLEPFLLDLGERCAVLARERGAALETELDARGQACVDRARFEQVVLIFVDNAAKYGASGQPITLTCKTKPGELVVEVIDRGPGIPPTDLPFVFERFYRVDKARARRQGGAGLGLAIAKTIVEAHGGRIEASSELNRGTTLRFSVPLASASRPEGRAVEQLSVGEAR